LNERQSGIVAGLAKLKKPTMGVEGRW